MRRLAIIVATAAILIANQSHAQTKENLLRGLAALELLIEEFNQHSADCGITENAIRASAMYPLSAAKIRVNPLSDVTLYVAIDSLYLREERICFSSIHMEAYIPQHVTLKFSDRETFAPVRLWQTRFLASSGQNRHPKRVSDIVEDLTKKFLTDWNLDNKPEPTSQQGHGSDSEERTISSGTAFAVTQAGDLVTSEHVVSTCSTVTVKQGNREFTGTISFRDKTVDLALIHLNREMPTGIPADLLPPPPFATLRQSPVVKPGEQVIAYGFPLRGALADEGNLTIGNVSAMRGLNNDPNEIQISAPVQTGNSGGPLLDSGGHVIGVVASKLDALNALVRSGDIPQNVNFAISLRVLKAFLAQGGVRATESASRVELRPDEVGDRAKSFTYAIECDPRALGTMPDDRWEVLQRRPPHSPIRGNIFR